MEVYFSTVFRYASIDQAGELVKLDWEKKQVVNKVSVAPRSLQFNDPNPRGNSRGGRGIAIIGDEIFVAGHCELQVYDKDLTHLRNITHPLMSSLHEVYYAGDNRLWVTSTVLNAGLLIDTTNGELMEEMWPQKMPNFKERWHLTPLDLDRSVDNRIRYLAKNLAKDPSHLHFNAITSYKGDLYGLFNRFGAVVNLSRQEVVFEDRSIYGAHNLIILPDGTIFVNDTRNQGVNIYNMNGRLVKRIDLLPFHKANQLIKKYKQTELSRKLLSALGLSRQEAVMPFFVRGLDIKDEILFIGMSPAAILCVNWETSELVDTFDYTDDVKIAVHGLKLT